MKPLDQLEYAICVNFTIFESEKFRTPKNKEDVYYGSARTPTFPVAVPDKRLNSMRVAVGFGW
jgi:hypothetical protein